MPQRLVGDGEAKQPREELVKEIEDLKRYEKNFQAVVEGSLDAMLIVDMDGAIRYANPAAERLFELSEQSMIGAVFGFPIVLTEPVELYVLRRFEKFVAVEMWIVQIHWKDHPAYLVSLRDITRIVRTREELRHYKEELEQEVRDRTRDLADLIVELRAEANEHKRAEAELRRSEADLTRAQARLQAILDSLPVGVFIADKTGKILEANRMVNVIWGGGAQIPLPGGVEGYAHYRGWWANTGKPVKPGDWALAQALKGQTSVGEIIDIQRFDGSRGTILNNAAPVKDREGNIIGAVVAIQDITERRRLEKELEEARDRSDLYLDLMAHDINNLNQIGIGYLELILYDILKCPEEKEYLERTLDALRSSSKLIDNVRKLQRVKAHELRHHPVDVCGMLSRAKSEYERVPGREVTINLAGHCECTVNANDLLHDVFTNLISNAIKHSEGPLTVNIDVSCAEENGGRFCRVAVEDNGPGISPDLKARLFNRLQRGNTKAHGKGLGLYLVKTLVDDFHGEIRAEDRVPGDYKKGAKFVVMLPAIEK